MSSVSARSHGAALLRVAATVAAVAGLAVSIPGQASAHTGELSTVVPVGPYRVVVRALPVAAGPGAALAFRASVAGRLAGRPIVASRVAILVARPPSSIARRFRAVGAGGSYSVLIPIQDPSAWRSLRYTIAITGPLGSAEGRYLPPDLFRQWLFEPWVLLAAAVALALFLRGVVRLRRRGRRDLASLGRVAVFVTGLAMLVLPLVSPLDVVGDHFLLSAHMLQHVLIGDVAPALLVVAVRGPLLFFVIPAGMLRAFARARPLRRAAAWLVRPRVALAVWAAAYGGWHVPAAYDWATRNQAVHDLEHASFVSAGLLVWLVLIDPARSGHFSRSTRLRTAAAVFLLGTVISDALIFSFHPLYPAYANQVERVFMLTPVRDQQLAGLVMTVDQLVTLGTCAAVLLWPLMRRRGTTSLVAPRLGQPA